MHATLRAAASVVAIFLLLGMGCQTTAKMYKGAKADPGDVLSDELSSDGATVWKDLYISLEATFKQQGDQLSLDGFWGFAAHPQLMFVRAKNFELKLYLLDRENRVLDYFTLSRSLAGDLDDQIKFSKEFTLPEGAVAASIGYEGRLIGERGEHDWVWKLPKRSH